MPFHIPGSSSSSRPSSRAPSPTRLNSRSAVSTPMAAPSMSRTSTFSTDISATNTDPLSDYFGHSVPSSSGYNTPYYGSYSDTHSVGGAITPGGTYFAQAPVEIILDSQDLVMRGQGADMNPAYLSGRVELNLTEATNIKDITMSLHGKAKVHFSEGMGTGAKNHHYTHPILMHDWSFLQGDKKHTHTLKAGHHSFPFSFMIEGNLPSTIRTFHDEAVITYKLHATVIRSGFASNFHSIQYFTLHRTFTPDALEFNQTLEIENTWPGKVMYAITLPYKAYAAGDEIPVNVKFMPLAKGVRVTSVTSVLKEYSIVHTRHSNHADQRVAASVKHELRDGRAVLVSEEPVRPPVHWNPAQAHQLPRRASTTPSRTPPATAPRSGGYFGGASGGEDGAEDSTAEVEEEEEEEQIIGDDEVDAQFTIPVPPWITPSHPVHPVFITHKLKWSCSISNADGHVSELRCALPIVILDNSLLEEARAAGASTRGLLFGGNDAEEAQQVDLPSYSNHVYDRIAIADSGGAAGYAPRSAHTSAPSSHHSLTPPVSRGPSRPGSPTGSRVDLDDDLPPRRELSSWADSELLRSLGSLRVHSNGSSPNDTPGTSRGPSRPLSRRNSRSGRSSRVGSRAGSRASSPERGNHSNMSPISPIAPKDERPHPERRHTGGLGGLLHLPGKHRSVGASKPILRNSSHIGLTSLGGDNIPRNSVSFTNLDRHNPHAGGSSGSRAVSFANEVPPRTRFHVEGNTHDNHEEEDEEDEPERTDPINQVPSYAIASRGFLGGGVTPIDVGLPTYDDSERVSLARSHRSDTALVQLGSEAAAAAEERAV